MKIKWRCNQVKFSRSSSVSASSWLAMYSIMKHTIHHYLKEKYRWGRSQWSAAPVSSWLAQKDQSIGFMKDISILCFREGLMISKGGLILYVIAIWCITSQWNVIFLNQSQSSNSSRSTLINRTPSKKSRSNHSENQFRIIMIKWHYKCLSFIERRRKDIEILTSSKRKIGTSSNF